jgi:hypothetical protein
MTALLIKGTLASDFCRLVFFIKGTNLVPWLISHFKRYKFAKILYLVTFMYLTITHSFIPDICKGAKFHSTYLAYYCICKVDIRSKTYILLQIYRKCTVSFRIYSAKPHCSIPRFLRRWTVSSSVFGEGTVNNITSRKDNFPFNSLHAVAVKRSQL